MSIMSLTLIGVFLFVGISTRQRLEKDCKDSLTKCIQGPQTPVSRNSSIVLTLKYSGSGKKIDSHKNTSFSPLSEEEIEEISSLCHNAKDNYGTISQYELAYMKRSSQNGTYMAFYDLTGYHSAMRYLLLSFLFSGSAAIVLFYVISLFLSHWCIRPIEKAWNRQQKFVADASHELKTPLTVILANTAILKEHREEPIRSKEKCLTYIAEEASHMSRLVNDMLFLAKSDSVREDIQKEPVNFSDVCLNRYLSFESVAFEKEIAMTSDVEEEVSVFGDAEKLGQLCGILLDNACKYTDKKGTVHVCLRKKGNTAVLEVTNSSAPIPKEQLSHLFERFYRADEARTRQNSGYGLGLSIACSIVEMHHGKITISSTAESGTTVHVEFGTR